MRYDPTCPGIHPREGATEMAKQARKARRAKGSVTRSGTGKDGRPRWQLRVGTRERRASGKGYRYQTRYVAGSEADARRKH